MPRLISVWRRHQRRQGPAGELMPKELKDVAAGVYRLSHGLTRDRALAGSRYLDDPSLLGAYLLFYWPTSYAQARAALSELSERPRHMLDLGSGPAPLAFAALDAGSVAATAADRSAPALALARELALESEESLSTRPWDASNGHPIPDGPYDLVTMGHVLNELYGEDDAAIRRRADLVARAAHKLKPKGSVLILEPALKLTSRALLRVRDLLVGEGYGVRAPCFFRGPCPALARAEDWCHADRPWEPPRLVAEIAQRAGLHKESLKMSYLILSPKGEAWQEPPSGRTFRIVSEPLAGKGRARFIGCGPEGRIGLSLQDKHRGAGNAVFFELARGDVVRVTQGEPKGDGLSLDDRSTVERIARAGLPIPRGA